MAVDNKRILIGEIATSHGLKGFVKVRTFVEDETLLNGKLFTNESGDNTLTVTLKNAMKDHWLAQVDGVSEKNGADSLRGTKLYIDRSSLPETNDDEYYIEDLKGMTVAGKDGKVIGTVMDVVNYGAGDLIDIKPPSGDSFYLPFTDETVLNVDFDGGIITAELPEMI
jgi:16S rRNA processing protein RimM